jgi:hypothetical protein
LKNTNRVAAFIFFNPIPPPIQINFYDITVQEYWQREAAFGSPEGEKMPTFRKNGDCPF